MKKAKEFEQPIALIYFKFPSGVIEFEITRNIHDYSLKNFTMKI